MKHFYSILAASTLMLLFANTVKAQDDFTESIVSDSTVWTFDDYEPIDNGDKDFVGTEEETIWTVESQTLGSDSKATGQLYVRNVSGHYFQMYAGSNGNKSGTFSNGSTWKTIAAARTQGNGTFLSDGIHDTSAGCKVISQTDRCVAFNVGCPGTVYVIWATAGSLPSNDRYAYLYANHQLGDVATINSETNSKLQYELKAEITADDFASGNTYVPVFYVATMSTFVYVVKFVPSAGSETAIKDIVESTTTDGKCYNLAGQEVAQPRKGIYIKNGKKYVAR